MNSKTGAFVQYTQAVNRYLKNNVSRDDIWDAITNYDDMVENIKSIRKIEIHELPKGVAKSSDLKGCNDISGLVWSETVSKNDQIATGKMTVTKCVGKEYYETYSKVRGLSFVTKVYIKEEDSNLYIGMEVDCVPLSCCGKLLMMCCADGIMREETRKALMSDLCDIQKTAEKSAAEIEVNC